MDESVIKIDESVIKLDELIGSMLEQMPDEELRGDLRIIGLTPNFAATKLECMAAKLRRLMLSTQARAETELVGNAT